MSPEVAQQIAFELCAQAAHEMNRVYCRFIGDDVAPSWEEASEAMKSGTIAGVIYVIRDNVTPEQSHASWMQHKLALGWSYGPKRDEQAKTHPCLLPYAELDPFQRKKDELYIETVRLMYKAITLT